MKKRNYLRHRSSARLLLATLALVVGCQGRSDEASASQPSQAMRPETDAPTIGAPSAEPTEQARPTEPAAKQADKAATVANDRETSLSERSRAAEEARRTERQVEREQQALPREPDFLTGRGNSEDAARQIREEGFRRRVAEGREKRTLEQYRKDLEFEDAVIKALLEDEKKGNRGGGLSGGAVPARR